MGEGSDRSVGRENILGTDCTNKSILKVIYIYMHINTQKYVYKL